NPPPGDERFDQQPLLDDPFDLVVPDGHHLAGRERIDLAEAAREQWIAPVPERLCRPHVMSACGAAGFTPDVVHHALDWNVTAHLVAHGLGVALIPRLALLTDHLPVTRVRCSGDPHRKLLTCTRGGDDTRPAAAAALAALRELAASAVAWSCRGGRTWSRAARRPRGAPDRPKGPERLLRPLRVVRVGRGCAARAASSRSCVRAGQAAAGVVARSWRRVTTSVSCSTTSESSAGCSSAKRVTEPGMDSLMSSTTVPPAMPTALRASSCAHTPPYWPKAVPTTATGLPEMAPAPIGRDSQSMAFFRTAG